MIYTQLYEVCRRQEEVDIWGIIEGEPYADRDRFQISLLTLSKSNQINQLLSPLKSSENRRFSRRIQLDKFT